MSTSVNSSTGLPDIPSLPPIEIPNTSFRASVDRSHLPPLDEDSHLSPRAFASPSPPPHRQLAGPSNDIPQPSSPNSSPLSPNLRKSFSVDSFARHSRSSPVSIVSRQHRTTPLASPIDEQRRGSVSARTADSPQAHHLPRDPAFSDTSRSRGASVSTLSDECGQTIPEESDVVPVRGAPQISTGPRRTGIKFKSKFRPTLPPGELPLPSRLHGTNPAAPPNTDSGDSARWLPVITTDGASHQNPNAGPSRQQSREDIGGASAGSSSSTSGLDYGGTRVQSVSLVPSTRVTPRYSTP